MLRIEHVLLALQHKTIPPGAAEGERHYRAHHQGLRNEGRSTKQRPIWRMPGAAEGERHYRAHHLA